MQGNKPSAAPSSAWCAWSKSLEMADIIVRGDIVLDMVYGKIFRDGT